MAANTPSRTRSCRNAYRATAVRGPLRGPRPGILGLAVVLREEELLERRLPAHEAGQAAAGERVDERPDRAAHGEAKGRLARGRGGHAPGQGQRRRRTGKGCLDDMA